LFEAISNTFSKQFGKEQIIEFRMIDELVLTCWRIAKQTPKHYVKLGFKLISVRFFETLIILRNS